MIHEYETIEQLKERIEAGKAFPKPELSTLNAASFALLSVAYDRLRLCVSNIPMILSIAQSIAQLAKSDQVRVEHVAEAIQYRALLDSENVKIYVKNTLFDKKSKNKYDS